jgi:MFS family permease
MIQSALLAALTLSGKITVPQILWLSAFQGLINAFDMPVRQAFVVEMIEDRADLSNAIALNSSMVNMARLIGPSMAGILIATVGEGGCFAIDAFSYVAVIASLILMHVRPPTAAPKKKNVLKELREGLDYANQLKAIRSVLGLLSLISLMGMPYMVLLPMIVTEQLSAGPKVLGWLTAASGLGALGGALYLASRKSVLGLGRVIPFSAAFFGVGLVGFAYSHWLLPSLVLMLLTGAGMMVQMAASNTILQTIVDEDKRGRVMAFYTMSFAGMAPFGSLLAGVLAERIGAPHTLMVGGMACVIGAILFTRALPGIRRQVRPIYIRLGILPEVAEGLHSAAQLTVPPED